MASMLIRTSLVRKFRLAFVLRVLFFLVPVIYYLAWGHETQDFETGLIEGFSSRRLLGIVDSGRNCTPPAILEFPSDGFTRSQRQHDNISTSIVNGVIIPTAFVCVQFIQSKKGFILFHCVLAIYCFLLLGTVCEQYFVPAIDIICERLDMASDVAGATFMAAASSSPELFINCVGTFVTEGDIGVGAIVGSAVFNVLAVPACCALFTAKVIDLDWWSVSRDCMMYAVAVVALILTLLDDTVYWHEALLLVLMYILYILAMVFNRRLGSFARSGCCTFNKPKLYTELSPLLMKADKSNPLDASKRMSLSTQRINDLEQGMNMKQRHDSTDSESSISSLWSWPGNKSTGFQKMFWVLTWPISLLLWATIPDCRRHQRLYPITFIMCISWIGGVSYLVAWIITIVGDTLNVPDSITGLTILAAGTSLPEAVSSVLVTMHGHGTMGISNSIGSNTFDILLCLGLPWLVKSLFYPSSPGNYFVKLNSSGLSYSAISLLSTLLALYSSLAINRFQLDWKIGVTCALIYIGFLMLATLIELNVLFVVNLPICPH